MLSRMETERPYLAEPEPFKVSPGRPYSGHLVQEFMRAEQGLPSRFSTLEWPSAYPQAPNEHSSCRRQIAE